MFLVRGLGLRSANILIKHFKEPERALDSTREELEALGVPPEVADDLLISQIGRAGGGGVGASSGAWRNHSGHSASGVSAAVAGDLRSADRALYTRKAMGCGSAASGNRWYSPSDRIWIELCRTFGGGSRGARPRGHFGIWRRGLDAAAHRGALRAGVTYAVFGSGLDFIYPEGKSQTRRFRGRKWRDYFGVSARHAALSAEFSDSEPDHCRNVSRRHGGRSCRIFRFAHHGAIWTRSRTEKFLRCRETSLPRKVSDRMR